MATARSVREEKSKQRFALQDFSLIKVSLVQGKTGWRIGSVEASRNYYLEASTRDSRVVVTEAVRLLRRLLQGEEVDSTVFVETTTALDIMVTKDSSIKNLIDIFTLRVLYRLGYVAHSEVVELWLNDDSYISAPPLSKAARKVIDKGLNASHL